MIRCKRCVMPNQRPDVPFLDGVCQACINYAKRPEINWAGRKTMLEYLLERNRNKSGFDCIVPSSGGKDSTYQVMTLLDLGVRPLVVTATTCHLTRNGRLNIDNLGRYATTIEVTPNREVRGKLNRLGLELVGDISWPEHVSIFTTPFRIAAQFGIPLIFYGENPQNQYGGPLGSEEARTMTRRWRSEFGGFLGLRPADMVGKLGISVRDMTDYEMPPEQLMEAFGIEAHFLGQYVPWDSHRNADVACRAGLIWKTPCNANYWPCENLDNAQTGLHDHFMYRKFGYGRGCAQISIDIRSGRINRQEALDWVREHDGLFPYEYAGVRIEALLEHIDMSFLELDHALAAFTNKDLFDGEEDRRPRFRELATTAE